ncbi:helix-hairpin-helix domain-containing protein [Pasteurella canis]|uniref:ComEA family DNA-binding protein n=1 Tax=Pasteurella canis TaxID=753 RepID=UPI001D10BE9F|nr:helix-hairpin-helix domain-containing protein [Pasteurella canis]UDW83715.1 helix-hairpin-helix domain-containing protein [Pasteurella canis]
MTFNSVIIAILTLSSIFTSTNLFAHSTNITNTPLIAVDHVSTESVTGIGKININNATAAELQHDLIGVGAKKAEAIIQYREAHGPFTKIEQLLEVQGIGNLILEKNKDRLIF